MSNEVGVRTGIERSVGAAAIVLVGAALWIALRVRATGVDQPYLMIRAQEVLFGDHHEFIDFPSNVIIHGPPLFAFRLFGWPIVFSWNLYLVSLSAISASVFAFRMDTSRSAIVWCIWFGLSLLLFDDTLLGQREYLFSVFWFPYLLARLTKPSSQFALWLDILCGAFLSIAISAKFYFAAFVLLIDLPILLLRGREQSFPAFLAMMIGGGIQAAAFFVSFGTDINLMKGRFNSYYDTVGVDYASVWKYLLGTPAVYITIGAIALMLTLRFLMRQSIAYALACAASGVICLALSILQGHPRPYTLIPLFLGGLACSLEAVSSQPAKWLHGTRHGATMGARSLGLIACIAMVSAVLLGDNGLIHAFVVKYGSDQPEYARIGPAAEDEYISWVRKHVGENEDVNVIALQYGGTSAFDPVLSTIRLGRRINSVNPILHMPLRAALVSGDRSRIDAAWDALIEEIASGAPAWVVVRRSTPYPMAPDFIKIMEEEPRFYSWLTSHYSRYEEFGPYVAYRRSN
jgi:hypothetical protein